MNNPILKKNNIKPKKMENQTSQNEKDSKKTESKIKKKIKEIQILNPYDTETIERKSKSNMAKKLNGHVPKNTNQFLHLITKDSSIGLGGMKWVYKLRDYKVEDETKNKNEEEKNQKKIKTTTNFKPPSFFEDDQERYKNRNKQQKRPFSTTNNFYTISHLTFSPSGVGTINQTQFNYSSTLREIKPVKDIFINKNIWQDLPYKLKESEISSFLLPILQSSKDQYKKIEKYIYKPYETHFDKIDYDNGKIYKKTLVKRNGKSFDGVGIHLSTRPYSSVYQEPNIFPYKNLFDKHTNSTCLFELGLRTYGNVGRNREKRITKDQFEKIKEESIKKKQLEAKKYKKNIQMKLANVFGEKVKKKE